MLFCAQTGVVRDMFLQSCLIYTFRPLSWLVVVSYCSESDQESPGSVRRWSCVIPGTSEVLRQAVIITNDELAVIKINDTVPPNCGLAACSTLKVSFSASTQLSCGCVEDFKLSKVEIK